MPFQIGNGYLPAAISNSRVNQIGRSDTSPDVNVWEKIKAFFCATNKPEALELIRQICHPPAGTTREDVTGRFEQLRTLAHGGFEENVQSGRHGENHFCILDENSREMLSVTLDDAGKYTVEYQGYNETHNLTPQTAEEYEAAWSSWEKAAPAGESPHRAAAVRKMRDCLHNGNPGLVLDDVGITDLPDHLPPNITVLSISGCRLASLPAQLPPGLQKLCAYENQLTSLPAQLPPTLVTLDVRKNQLASLPAQLPPTLVTLYANHNQLASLPAQLPPTLVTLGVHHNQLASLPAQLPPGLQELYANNNQLTSLPAQLPPGLQELYASNNQLTSLPESTANLRSNAIVELDNNPLSERTRQDLETMTCALGYRGPAIFFSMAGPSVPRENRPLHLAVADWLTPAKEGEPTPAGSWRSFGQENDATSFSAFLDRLSETENCKKDPGFKAQISSWLTQLARDDELRAKTFAMATEATSSCEDRVTLALNQMKNVQLVYDAEKGKYDNNLPGLVSAGREMFRLEKLEQIARDKVSTLRFVDEIEVYLAYQNKLKEPLELSSVTAEMRFFGVSGVTDSDLQAAELQVKTAEDSQFSEWILQWAPLRSVLERAYPEDFEKLTEKKISDYDDAYRKLSNTELKPAGLIGNSDAERAVGARALGRAEQAFHAGLRPLANRMLGGHLKARWS